MDVNYIGYFCVKFLPRDLTELANRIYCNSQREHLMNSLQVMMAPIAQKKFNTKAWAVLKIKLLINKNFSFNLWQSTYLIPRYKPLQKQINSACPHFPWD